MQLPRLDHPIYTCKLFSKESPISFRPFTVKEKKILLMAVESKEVKNAIDAIKQIINNCILTPIDVDQLPLIDIEILFLNLKARSEGEIAAVHYKCKNEVILEDNTTKECGMIIEVPVDLLNIPIINVDKTKKIMLSESVGVVMKYPSFNLINQLIDSDDMEAEFIIVANAIDTIFDKDETYLAKDATQEELISFLMNLPEDKYEKVKDFIESIPTHSLTAKKNCPKCSYSHEFKMEGLNDFFL